MDFFRLLKEYFRFYISAGNQYALHSPFLYRLYLKVIRTSHPNKKEISDIEGIRQSYLKNNTTLTYTDPGAGSRTMKRARKISSIVKTAVKPKKQAKLLYRLCQEHQPNNIIELGTSLGISTAYMAKACPQANVITIEGVPEVHKIALGTFQTLALTNVTSLQGLFQDKLPSILASTTPDLVYIDGHHTKEATLAYFHMTLPKVHENTLIIVDDIYWSAGMKEAWVEICAHEEVTVSIDLFHFGLIYFKKTQPKQHFKLRF